MNSKALLTLMMVLATPAFAEVERSGTASATFSGKGPAGFKMEGKTEEVTVKDDGKTVAISVPLTTLKTGIELRDRHMREKYLEVDKFPHAVLEVPWSAIKLPEDGKTTTQTVPGKMSLHGKTRDVSVTYTVKCAGDTYAANGTVPLNLKDFDIILPNYLGVTVKPDIDTATSFQFKKK
ncbi:MAG: YceI family protein [Cystobacter sp.]